MIALLLACAETPTAAPAQEAAPGATAPDLVLVGIAGLRSDQGSRASDWFLEAFAQEKGVVFTNAYAQSPATFVSLGSVLAGRYPSAIPLCGLTTAPGEATAQAPWCNTFPKDQPSLPSVLALYGYRTGLVVADVPGADHLAPLFQDTRVVSQNWDDTATDWEKVRAEAKSWWDADASRPRLLVVATSDLMAHDNPTLRDAMGLDFAGPGGAPSRMDRPRILSAYKAAARQAGKESKALLDTLREGDTRPLWAALFGTNGLNLGDSNVPGQVMRGNSWNDLVLDRTIHVPLALVGPSTAPEAHLEDRIVELVDLVPTFTTLAGAVPPAGIPGADLLAASTEAEPTAYAEFGDMLAVRAGTKMWSVRAFFFDRSSLDPELTNFVVDYKPDETKYAFHDLSRDPFQNQNQLMRDPQGARRMHDLLVKLRTGPGAPPQDALDAKRIWELRMAPSQGYW